MFNDEGLGGPDAIENVTAEGGLGLFVRSLVGLDREAAKAAFGAFLVAPDLHGESVGIREHSHRAGCVGF